MSPSFNVLSLDGGGVRGVYTARLLARLTEACPEFLGKTALFAGTSTGGILALGLAHGLGPGRLTRLYQDNAKRIFRKRLLGGLWGAKYDPAGLRVLLAETFGETTLSELNRLVLIPAYDLDAPEYPDRPRSGAAKFFESFDDCDQRIVDVALATSAAPTYFPSHLGYVDGGVIANNPAACASAQALAWGAPFDTLRVLSLGTGQTRGWIPGQANDWGIARWASKLPALFVDGVAGVADFQCRQLLEAQYHRLDGVLPKPVELDDASAVGDLVEAANGVDLSSTVDWLRHGGWL